MEKIELEYNIQLRYVKDGKRYGCICDRLKIAGYSKRSIQEAEDRLFDKFDNKIREYEFSIKLKINIIENNTNNTGINK